MPLASFQAVEKNGPAVYFEGVEVKDLMTHQAPGIDPGGGSATATGRRSQRIAGGGWCCRARGLADEASAPRWAADCDGGSRSPEHRGGRGSRPPHDASLEMESWRPGKSFGSP